MRFLVTKKSVRERPKLVLDKYRARMQKERRDSGVEVEETELDRALEEINETCEAAEEDILLVSNKKKTDEDRAMGEEIRKNACEKLSETMKRKEGEGSSEPKRKRSRKGGNDTIEFFGEKGNINMAMKQEDQKARREQYERQTRPYELALANQQQQQQQSNQLMSLMIGLMQKIAEKKDVLC